MNRIGLEPSAVAIARSDATAYIHWLLLNFDERTVAETSLLYTLCISQYTGWRSSRSCNARLYRPGGAGSSGGHTQRASGRPGLEAAATGSRRRFNARAGPEL